MPKNGPFTAARSKTINSNTRVILFEGEKYLTITRGKVMSPVEFNVFTRDFVKTANELCREVKKKAKRIAKQRTR